MAEMLASYMPRRAWHRCTLSPPRSGALDRRGARERRTHDSIRARVSGCCSSGLASRWAASPRRTVRAKGDLMHAIMWKYHIESGRAQEFEEMYGPHGAWAQLFGQGEGYVGAELLRATENPLRYITIDRWTSGAAFETFRHQHSDNYDALNRRCDVITEQETSLGTFFYGAP